MQPENLLLDSQGNLKISDFGLSAWPAQVYIFLKLYHTSLFDLFLSCFLVNCRDLPSYVRHVEHRIMLPQRYVI